MRSLNVAACGESFAEVNLLTSAFADVTPVACGYVLYALFG